LALFFAVLAMYLIEWLGIEITVNPGSVFALMFCIFVLIGAFSYLERQAYVEWQLENNKDPQAALTEWNKNNTG
jgi:Flp pilus assembly protein TadB